MRKTGRYIYIFAVSLCLSFFTLWIGLSPQVDASSRSIVSVPYQLETAATPVPEAQWHIAEGNSTSDWDVYLTGSDIFGIALDGNMIWATSNGGLLRWDRDTGSVTQYLAPRFPLPSNNLSQVLLHAEKLYISGYGGLVIFDREDNWTLYMNEDIGLELGYFVPMAFVDDVLWIGAEDGIGQLFPDGHWEIVRAGEDTFSNNIISKIDSREDGVYVVVALGPSVQDARQVWRFADGFWEIVDRPLMIYAEAPDGSLWKGEDHTLFKSDDQGVTWDKILEADRYIQPRAFDVQDRVYAAEEDTIYVIDNAQIVETFRFTDIGPELNFTNIIEWDNNGRLWIATDGRGLTMFDGERWHNWQDGMSGMRDDCIRGMAIGEEKLYAGTHGSAGTGGVNVFDLQTQQWTNFWPGESELSGGGVDGIAIDSQGRVYFPTSAGVLDIYNEETWSHIPMPLPEGFVLSTSEGLFDKEGNYWVGTEGTGLGLWKYDGSEWTIYDIPASINALVLDQKGHLWVGTSEGLVVRNPDRNWMVYTADQLPLGDGWIKDLAVDSEGRVWMISYNGLIVFNGQEYQEFSPSLVGASGWGDAVAFDPQGNMWVEAGMGIATFRGKPGIEELSSLTLSPANTIPEEEMVIDFDELVQRYEMPTTPMLSPQMPSWLVLAGICIAPMLCLLSIVVCGAVVYFVIRREKAIPTGLEIKEDL
jgi:ligand-binding sensor domain-containing protein